MSDEHVHTTETPDMHISTLETPTAPPVKALSKNEPEGYKSAQTSVVMPSESTSKGEGADTSAPESASAASVEIPIQSNVKPVEQPATAVNTHSVKPDRGAEKPQSTNTGEKSAALIREQLRYCATILKGLKRHPQSPPFQLPVDPVALNIPDYFEIIKTPMDLGTVSKKLEASEYPTAEAFIADVRLMLSNCFTYNHPDSQVTKMGRSLEKYFNQSVSRIPQTLPSHDDATTAAARRKSESAAVPAAPRARRESHAPTRLANTQPGHSTPRGRSRSTSNPEMAFCNTVLRELLKKTHQAVSWPFLEPVDPVKLGIPDYFDVIKTPMDLSTVKKKLEAGQYNSADQFEADVRLIFSNCYSYNAPESDVVNLCRAFEKIFESKLAQKPANFGYNSGSSLDDFDSDSEKILEINRQIQTLQQELNTLLMRRKSRSHSTASSSASRVKKPTSRPTSKPTPTPTITEEEFLSRPMSFEDKRQLSIEVNNLAPEKLGRVVEIIQAGMALEANGDSDVIELDIESLNTKTLRQLQKYVMECKGITSLAAILGEAPIKRKKPTAPGVTAPKKTNTGSAVLSAAGATPATAAAAAAAQAMSTDDESSEDDLD